MASAAEQAANAGLNSDPITMTLFLLSQQQDVEEATGDFTIMLSAVQLACKSIATAVRKAGILNLYGLAGAVNATGDDVKPLDLISDTNFCSALKRSGKAKVLVSEEQEEAIVLEGEGKYCAVFDPLDGSSNIDCNVSVGSIFGIYKRGEASKGDASDVLQPGTALVASGYCMYGSSTQMVLCIRGGGVHLFTLDPSVGEFLLSKRDLKIPAQPKTIYSVNEGNSRYFSDAVKRIINRFKEAEGKPYSARYVGSMVSDLHRTLLYGGVFFYPGDSKSPNGKLRLLYEANPMSMIIEEAGGASTTGKQRVMEIMPTTVHQRTPIFIGCQRDIDIVLEEFAKEEA